MSRCGSLECLAADGADALLVVQLESETHPFTRTVFGYASYAMIPDLDQLTLEEKVGQVVCFGWSPVDGQDAASVNEHARALVEEMHVGSVVLMGRNVVDPQQIRQMLDELQSLSRIPILVSIDQEGGVVNRIPSPLHSFPGNMALGAIAMHDPELALELTRAQAAAQAEELRALGIHWNFAPVADVNNNPENPIIGVRSFGESAEMVAWLSSAAVDGYQENGILACAKHFPGHGDTAVDSHLALPTVKGDWERISSVELAPFRSVIEHGVGSIMTTHILFPSLDASAPATLSVPLLSGLLRNRMEYDGIVITDCMEMDAISATAGTAHGAVQALKAGADVVLICHTRSTQRQSIDAILNAVDHGEIPVSRLDEAAGRALSAKRRYCSTDLTNGEPWRNPEFDRLQERIAAASVTIARNSGIIPLKGDGKVGVVSAHKAAAGLADALRRVGKSVDFVAFNPRFPERETDSALASLSESAGDYGCLIVATSPREPWAENPIDVERQATVVRRLDSVFGGRLIAVALREPYDIRKYAEVRNYVCGYGYSAPVLKAIAEALTGRCVPTAKLPVTVI